MPRIVFFNWEEQSWGKVEDSFAKGEQYCNQAKEERVVKTSVIAFITAFERVSTSKPAFGNNVLLHPQRVDVGATGKSRLVRL
jgi:hypothetical protein